MPSPHALATCLFLACALVMASGAVDTAVAASGKASNRKVLVDPVVLPTASDANSTMSTGLPDDFVEVKNGKFVINGQPFVFAGWNIWEVLDAASYAPPPFRHLGRDGREMIKLLMGQAVESGLTVMRMWGHTITPGHAMQPEKGSYNEKIFEGLDFILEEARIRGLKVIVVFADNWYPTGGLMNYVQWVKGDAGTRYDFFTDAEVKRLYKRNILALLNRRNTKNGRLYKDDPTIMAWNLANEARCEDCDAWVMQMWIDEMAQYVKQQDFKHLLGVGHEGFYSQNSPNKDMNPGAPQSDWASKNGQSYPENLASSHIDYVAIHVWPDNWKMKTPDFLQEFTRGHVEDARYLGKPFVLEEFGKIVNDEDGKDVRDKYFKAAYEVAEQYALDVNDGVVQGTECQRVHLHRVAHQGLCLLVRGDEPTTGCAEGGWLRGAAQLFWHWYDIGVGPGRYGLWYTDSTFDIVRHHATKMNRLSLAKAQARA